jgi:hypothetical protein
MTIRLALTTALILTALPVTLHGQVGKISADNQVPVYLPEPAIILNPAR